MDSDSVTQVLDMLSYSTLGLSMMFPVCEYWDTDNYAWETDGCFVYNLSNGSVFCSCTHLSTFHIQMGEWTPSSNQIPFWSLRSISVQNMIDYPVVWASFLPMIVLMSVFVCIHGKKHNKTVLAYHDIVFHDIKDAVLKRHQFGQVIEVVGNILPNSTEAGNGMIAIAKSNHGWRHSILRLIWEMFKIHINDDHIAISIFKHTACTNFTFVIHFK